MSRSLLKAALAALSIAALFSCSGKEEPDSGPYCRVKDAEGAEAAGVDAPAEGLTTSFKVESDVMWSVNCSSDWLAVTPSQGNKYGNFNLTIYSNRTAASRTATVTISPRGMEPVKITVYQAGKKTGGDDSSLDLRFMSFNIRTGGKSDGSTDEPGHEWTSVRKPAVIAMFADIDPDIAVLQECRQEQLRDLESAMPRYTYYRYACDGVLKSGVTESCTGDIFKNNGARNVIMVRKGDFTMTQWGRFWLSETPDVPSTFPITESKKVTLWVKLKEMATGHEMYVFNIHFVTPGKGDCLTECAECTVAQMKKAIGQASLPVFLAGDFNAVDSDPRIAAVPAYMLNARSDAPLTDGSMTYNHFSTNQADWKRLDHIFYLNAEPMQFKVINSDKYGTTLISDHWPVVCDLKIK